MKKIILAVILVAAIGGAAYWLLQNKKQNAVIGFKQEQIIGKWKLDSLSVKNDSTDLALALITALDSNLMKYTYDFREDGKVLHLLQDSVLNDSSTYYWTKEKDLILKEQGEPVGDSLNVEKLNRDSLVLRSKDSTTMYFKKAK
jgi:hypothetical protein